MKRLRCMTRACTKDLLLDNDSHTAVHGAAVQIKKMVRAIVPGASLLVLSACSSGFISAAGPSTGVIVRQQKHPEVSGVQLIDITDAMARQLVAARQGRSFSATFSDGNPVGMNVGTGDTIEVIVWEAPPAALFSSGGDTSFSSISSSSSRPTTLPEQMVGSDGRITVPFVGQVTAAGRSTNAIATDIVRRLSGKAHLPQVIVRITRNATSLVTVIGDVAQSARLPLTVRGERVLDAIAGAGGVSKPVGKITIQITRGNELESMPLAKVIADPRQNIVLAAGDVVTALYQPFSFTALGATGKNEELPMETQGITLAEALGRVGGLQDQRSDARGVFIFRFEDPAALGASLDPKVRLTPDGKVPVIYRVNLKDPAMFFAAQSFPMRDKDVLYVSNAPFTDIQKFVSIISSTVFPIASLATVVKY
jgi:polysaccharide export outer membrane protein